jgi:hypothetical protein
LEEAKELQSIRKRSSGVSASGLAYGVQTTEEETLAPDPFKLKTGGFIDLKTIDPADVQKSGDEVVKHLASQFSAETQTRDDETHMMKYIEDEMAKRKGKQTEKKILSEYEAKVMSLYKLSEKFKINASKKSEDMLSNQMLSGIPEVDLGLDSKFKNIEETEIAKQKMIDDQNTKKDDQVSMIPRNMASNFTLHSLRFFKEKERSSNTGKKEEPNEPPVFIPVVGIDEEPELKLAPAVNKENEKKKKIDHTQQPSDDYHFDRFNKKAKR